MFKFDAEQAETLIKRQEEFSGKTGNPCLLDVVASTAEALVKYLDFVSETSNVPFLVDGASSSRSLRM